MTRGGFAVGAEKRVDTDSGISCQSSQSTFSRSRGTFSLLTLYYMLLHVQSIAPGARRFDSLEMVPVRARGA